MADRYTTYRRPRSPTISHQGRISLPINVGGNYQSAYSDWNDWNAQYPNPVQSPRRETVVDKTRTATSNNGNVTKTTYKINPARPTTVTTRSNAPRDTSRTRSATVDARPIIVTTAPASNSKHVRVPHSAGGRAPSPPKNLYRSSEDDYYLAPATSTQRSSGHRKRHSTALDNADMHRLATDRERERDRDREKTRAGPTYVNQRPRGPIYANSLVRHADTVADDYGENGYRYTNVRDLVEYDLKNDAPPKPYRRDSFEERNRPVSTIYPDPGRSYHAREREGPPTTTRGWDKIPVSAWHDPVRMSASPAADSLPTRPLSRIERVEKPLLDAEQPQLRRSLSGRPGRPVSVYHDSREPPRQRDAYYEARDDDLRRERAPRYDRYEDVLGQRGYDVRQEKGERLDRSEYRSGEQERQNDRYDRDRPERLERTTDRVDRDRYDRPERNTDKDRYERSTEVERYPERADWLERSERPDRPDRDNDRLDTKSKLAAGFSTAASAIGLGGLASAASKKLKDDEPARDRDRDDHRRQRDFEDEHRRRREAREAREVDERGVKERWHRDEDRDAPRERVTEDYPSSPRETKMTDPFAPLSKDKDRAVESGYSRDTERGSVEIPVRERMAKEPTIETNYHDQTRDNTIPRNVVPDGERSDARSDDVDDLALRPPIERKRRISGPSFNPKDTMDLQALKDQLNAQKASPPKETLSMPARSPRGSFTKDRGELEAIRTELNQDRGRELPRHGEHFQPTDRKVRLVSPPRDKQAPEKTVKGILRQPREKFPEDPSPIREGVAPLKDAKKDGVPPDARWTKIARKLVNPEALEQGKERYEAREDFVIVLRVLSREEIQGYAVATQQIRAAREEEEDEDRKRDAHRRARRERHERHRRDHKDRRHKDSHSESDTTEDDTPKLLEAHSHLQQAPISSSLPGGIPTADDRERDRGKKRTSFADETMMTGALGTNEILGSLREDEVDKGTYGGYMRNPPPGIVQAGLGGPMSSSLPSPTVGGERKGVKF